MADKGIQKIINWFKGTVCKCKVSVHAKALSDINVFNLKNPIISNSDSLQK